MSASRISSQPVLAVLIATRNRPQLLQRALNCVWSQSRLPDHLVVIDDARPGEISLDHRSVDSASRRRGIHPILLRNQRTSGPAGAWNSGLDQLYRRYESDPSHVFVAILDDDDEWDSDHLAVCWDQAVGRSLHMVVSGITRIDPRHPTGIRHAIPDGLDSDRLLATGQHIQGSNLFVRLDKLLDAGLFSEELPSCTDRDLCLKLEELGDLRLASTRRWTVAHHADERDDRCSTPNSPQKREGLTRFWLKWRHRMSDTVEAEFLSIAESRFGWRPPNESLPPSRAFQEEQKAGIKSPTDRTVNLVVGVATDSSTPDKLVPLLEWLLEFGRSSRIGRLCVMVVENGPRPEAGGEPLREMLEVYRERGMAIRYADHERQRVDAKRRMFEIEVEQIGERLPIAVTRTMLAVYAGRLAQAEDDSWVWILDDDYRPHALKDSGVGALASIETPDLDELVRLQDDGCDLVIGEMTGPAPLPFLSTLRTQMLDLLRLVQTWDGLGPDECLPDRSPENHELMSSHADYFYDFPRSDCGHLERAAWLAPEVDGETVAEACGRLAGRIEGIPFGQQLFRPFVLSKEQRDDEEFIRRGGTAIFFNPRHLLEIPNFLAYLDGNYTRRSEMITTILGKYQLRLDIRRSDAIAGYHDRSIAAVNQSADFKNLAADIVGCALYRAFSRLWENRGKSQGNELEAEQLAYSEAEIVQSGKDFEKLLRERWASVSMSFRRVSGVERSLRKCLNEARRRRAWWVERHGFGDRLLALCEWIKQEIDPAAVSKAKAMVTGKSVEHWRQFLVGQAERWSGFRRALSEVNDIGDWLGEQRISSAAVRLNKELGVHGAVCLGFGREGVVFESGGKRYKVFDGWAAAELVSRSRQLRRWIGAWPEARVLYPLEEMHEIESGVILIYPFEDTEPYRGGHGEGLVALLKECRELGVVCRNLHPKNLRVSARGLRLIDYGRDIVPFSDLEFRQMAKRAWLTWRWHHRSDLAILMRRSTREENLPELDGFDRFLTAFDDYKAERDLRELIENEVEALSPKRLLDFGCGKGKLACRLAREGREVCGYDPDASLVARWRLMKQQQAELRFVTNRSDISGVFDTVVCSLVLCELDDGPEYEQALRDLRSHIAEDGRAIVAVCNPLFDSGGATPVHRERRAPLNSCYGRTYVQDECVGPNLVERKDVHRSLRRWKRDLRRIGFEVEDEWQTKSVDLTRFEPASDFLIFRLRPVDPTAVDVSLMIKSCIMEWETIESQVKHLVTQLEGGAHFRERVLVVDSREDGFLRQYAKPNAHAFRDAVDRLLNEEWIDRVVETPRKAERIKSLNQRWFACDTTATHAANGAQVAAVLAGFESCAADYILHVDSDAMICRRDERHNYLSEMTEPLETDPRGLTVSLNIAHQEDRPYTNEAGGRPWRIESRGGLIRRSRLLEGRPYENPAADGVLSLTWYRSVDMAVKSGRWHSYRGGDRRTFYIHPPNTLKETDPDTWMLMLDYVERAKTPQIQFDEPEIVGDVAHWFAPERNEPFIFVVCGRDVTPGRFWRCWDSILAQSREDWGAIIIDDHSNEETREFIRLLTTRHAERVSVLQPRRRRGLLANLVHAVRHMCTDPESVILTVDADDCLLGSSVLERLSQEYANGADMTVGSMLRSDKMATYPVEFARARAQRGGNVWQHLRTFKKGLFEMIDDGDLRVDGRYVDRATDWAYMLPLAEMAKRPAHITEPLYFYEPNGKGDPNEFMLRESIIAHLISKPGYCGTTR